jgi:hypothetical protein
MNYLIIILLIIVIAIILISPDLSNAMIVIVIVANFLVILYHMSKFDVDIDITNDKPKDNIANNIDRDVVKNDWSYFPDIDPYNLKPEADDRGFQSRDNPMYTGKYNSYDEYRGLTQPLWPFCPSSDADRPQNGWLEGKTCPDPLPNSMWDDRDKLYDNRKYESDHYVYNGSDASMTADSKYANYILTRARDKRSLDGQTLKEANFYRYHYGNELEESENRPWWGRADY